MKKLFILFTSILCIFGLTGCGTSVGSYADADKYLVGNQIYDENITSLDIDWVNGKITLIEDESISGVKIEETTNLTKKEELVHSYLNNGELKIKFFASNYRRFGFTPIKKELVVTYKPGLENFNLDLTSGNCLATQLTATKCNIDMTSGSAKIDKIIASTCDIDMTSGNFKIDNLMANEFSSECTSGDIKINKADVKDFDAEMTSGNYSVSFINVEKATFDMTSGDINMTLPEDGGQVNIYKTSGSIITNRECSVNNNIYTFGNGSASIEVKMTSGKVIIN